MVFHPWLFLFLFPYHSALGWYNQLQCIPYFFSQGVPSLFSDLSPLYEHPGKVTLLCFVTLTGHVVSQQATSYVNSKSCWQANILEQLFLKIEDSIRTSGCFPGW